MKRSLLLSAIIAGVLAVAQPAPAQTVLMSQDFNGSWSTANPPIGWRIYCDGDTSASDWHRAPDSGLNRWPDNPTPYALLDSAPTEAGLDSLISPPVNCSGCNVIVLRCSTFFKGVPTFYQAKLLGAVDGGSFDYEVFDYHGLTIGPALQEFDLSWAVGHGQVQVAWFFTGVSDGISYWAIDDVSIVGDTVADDVGCVAILAPTDTVDFNVMVTPQAVFKNYSPGPVTFPVRMTIGSEYVATDTVHDLAPGESTTVDFAPWSAAPGGIVPVEAMTLLHGDIDPSNDSAHGSAVVRVRDVAAVRILQPPEVVGENRPVTPTGAIRSYCSDPQLVTVYFTIHDSGAAVVYSASLAQTVQPGESLVIGFPTWIAGPLGQFTDTLRVELDGDVNPENDVIGSQFEVMNSFHDVGVVAITSPADTVSAGPVTPGAYVRNFGTFVETFFVKCRVLQSPTPEYYDSAAVTALNPGESTLVAFPVWTAVAGSYTARCTTDLPGDASPSNNWREKGFVVVAPPVPPGWSEGASMPLLPSGKDIKEGGWLVYDRGLQLVFGAKGYKQTDFYAYSPLGDSWHSLAAIPPGVEHKLPQKGSFGCTDGNGALYATKGNNTPGFWKYEITKDTWYQKMDVPLGASRKKVKSGAGLQYCLYNGVGYVYLLKGYKNEFYRYDIAGDAWHTLPSAPGEKWDKGSWIVYDGAHTIYAHMGKKHLFYAFNTETDVWSDTLTAMPIPGANGEKKSKDGSCATWYDASILALKGGNTQELWRYFVAGDTWHQLDTIPSVGSSNKRKRVKSGAGIVSVGGNVFYATKGNKCREIWRYRLEGNVGVREDCAAVALPPRPDGLCVAPNPATGWTTIRLSSSFSSPSRLCVYDIRGSLVMERAVAAPSFLLDCRGLTPGVYFVHARGPHVRATCRLVKE